MPVSKQTITVFYDGACPLCAWEIKQYAAQDAGQNLNFVDVSGDRGELPAALDRELALRCLHVMTGSGLKSGAEAFTAIWSVLAGWRFAAAVARAPLVLPLLEGCYRSFLLVRPLVSRMARYIALRRRALP